jgi:hypothetical protein
MAKEKTKEERIRAELKRLEDIFIDLDVNTRAMLDGLLRRAAYMRITLEDYESDLDTGGYVEQFSQSEKLEPYERERPVARLYNTMNKNYQCIMKQLFDTLPEAAPQDASAEIMRFAVGGRK